MSYSTRARIVLTYAPYSDEEEELTLEAYYSDREKFLKRCADTWDKLHVNEPTPATAACTCGQARGVPYVHAVNCPRYLER